MRKTLGVFVVVVASVVLVVWLWPRTPERREPGRSVAVADRASGARERFDAPSAAPSAVPSAVPSAGARAAQLPPASIWLASAPAGGQTREASVPVGGLTGPRWPGDSAWAAQLAAAATRPLVLPDAPGAISAELATEIALSSPDPEERARAIEWLGGHGGPTVLTFLEQLGLHAASADADAARRAAARLRSRFAASELPDSTAYAPDVAAAMTGPSAAR